MGLSTKLPESEKKFEKQSHFQKNTTIVPKLCSALKLFGCFLQYTFLGFIPDLQL